MTMQGPSREFAIHGRISGACLSDHIGDLTKVQLRSLAASYAKHIIAFENVTFAQAGILSSSKSQGEAAQHKGVIVLDWRILEPDASDQPCSRPEDESLYDLLHSRLQSFYERAKGDRDVIRLLRTLKRMLADMRHLGWFEHYPGSHPIVLHHPDLYARNIMIDRPKSKRVKVSGIIDMNDMLALLRVLSRRVPAGLWRVEPFEDICFGQLGDNGDFWTAEDAMPNKKGQAFKDIFGERMTAYDENWTREAYGEGLWLRRLSRFLLMDVIYVEGAELKAAEWMRNEWAIYLYKYHHGQVVENGVEETDDSNYDRLLEDSEDDEDE